MMTTFWTIVLACLVAILAAMTAMLFIRKKLFNKLNFVFAMNTLIILLIMVTGFVDGRVDMYIDIALSYSILGFVTSVILAKYIGGRKK